MTTNGPYFGEPRLRSSNEAQLVAASNRGRKVLAKDPALVMQEAKRSVRALGGSIDNRQHVLGQVTKQMGQYTVSFFFFFLYITAVVSLGQFSSSHICHFYHLSLCCELSFNYLSLYLSCKFFFFYTSTKSL